MKAPTKLTALFAALIISVSLGMQVQIHGQQPSQAVATANNVQLVIEGKVVKVHDGDTVTVVDQDNKKFNIRLQGIDAPELKQEFGAASQKNLSAMALGKQVSIYWNKVDKYRRTVGTIMLDGRDINIEQVRAGVAWHYKKYEDEQNPADRLTYAAAEQSARAAKLGLWNATNAVAPGDWRQEVKTKRWGPPPPEGTIIGSANSKKYHRPDCPGYRDMAERNRVFFKSVAEAETAGFKRAGNCPAEVATIKTTSTSTKVSTTTSGVVTRPTEATTAPPTMPVTVATTVGSTSMVAAPSTVLDDKLSLKVVGNKNSKIFHLLGCSGYDRVSENNRVYFNSATEAESAGYRIAKNCSPEAADIKTTTAASFKVSTTTSAVGNKLTQAATSRPTGPTTLSTTDGAKSIMAAPSNVLENTASQKAVGNKNSKIFHLPGCSGYDRVSEKNRVYFNSAADAESAGYRIAKNCSPANPD